MGGSSSNRAYVRTGSNADGEPLFCVGYRAGGGQGHARVTVHPHHRITAGGSHWSPPAAF